MLNPDESNHFPRIRWCFDWRASHLQPLGPRGRRFLEKGHGLNPPFPEENHWNSDLDGIFMGSEGDFDGI